MKWMAWSLVLIALTLFGGGSKTEEPRSEHSRAPEVTAGEFDAFAGGYPVPPMPGQVLPEFAGVVRGSSSEAADAVLAADVLDTDSKGE